MELPMKIMYDLSVPSMHVDVKSIQNVLTFIKQDNSKYRLNRTYWSELASKLWEHIIRRLNQLDDQLLCATCFYSVVVITYDMDHFIERILHAINPEPNSRLPVVCLMYGMLQSSFLTQENYSEQNFTKIAILVKRTVDLLLVMGYEYSKYTFVIFKTLKSCKKLSGGVFEKFVYNKENLEKLLTLVNNNWENPVTGVRDMNRSIFQTVISKLDDVTYEEVLKDIEGFYWNKAKFLMLAEIIESHNKGDIMSLVRYKWIDGLIYSLHKPGLVSAGTDMYNALLKKITAQYDWCQLFLCRLLKIFGGTNTKAIENFSNYWCLSTMKKFETINQVLIDELDKSEDSEHLLFSKLCIMKQANKLSMLQNDWTGTSHDTPVQKAVLAGMVHCNSNIRILAFDILCISQSKSIPSPSEYDLVLEYLQNNINSDNTVLRINLFNSFNNFLAQLHSTFLNVILKLDNNEALANLISFCKRMQKFVTTNINMNGNYQRKITTVKLCDSVITHFSTIPKKKRDQIRRSNVSLMGYLKLNGHWILSTQEFVKKLIRLLKDPADDVRENVIQILRTHYNNELQDAILLNDLINDAKNCISSKFFYEISCGHSMFKLLIHVIITRINSKEKPISVEFQSVASIYDFAYNELVSQYKEQTNVLNSIESGKQLHSFMGILIVLCEECITSSYKTEIENRLVKDMDNLLQVLEGVSNQFALEDEGSSDFSKINDIVQSIINSSDYPVDQEDTKKMSDLQQIVLNCLWLNVKAACDLAAIITQCNRYDPNTSYKCLNIIARVLETSRHKGAIEAAGAALGRSIQYLSSQPIHVTAWRNKDDATKNFQEEVQKLRQNSMAGLPFLLLEKKLNVLMFEPNVMSSITRRGAGLSIMLHRIVSSDMKQGKPLFRYFMKILLKLCNVGKEADVTSAEQASSTDADKPPADQANSTIDMEKQLNRIFDDTDGNQSNSVIEANKTLAGHSSTTDDAKASTSSENGEVKINDKMENQVDLPQAIYIHFLTRVVNDSSLATDVMYYSVVLAELAFENLTSPHWQIRNAALQLYGALIPRIIGQKKASGSDDETIATVAYDEIQTHFPKLWKYMTTQIKRNSGDLIQTHSNLVPILNMLANSAKRYHFSFPNMIEQEVELRDLFYHLIMLLNSPIYTVRRLTAKTIFNIYEFEYISEGILNYENISENMLHGFLMLLNLCHNYYSSDIIHENSFKKLNYKFRYIFSNETHSYICKKIFEDIFINYYDMDLIENAILEKNINDTPGVHIWAEARIKKFIEECDWMEVPKLLKILLQQSDYEKYCKWILIKIQTHNSFPNHLLLRFAVIILQFKKNNCSSIVWEMLYEISLKTIITGCVNPNTLLQYLKDKVTYNTRYIVPLLARYLGNCNNDNLIDLINIINNLSDSENSDVEMRCIAAVALNEIAQDIHKLPELMRVSVVKCIVVLLQDEDEDVRNLSAKFYAIIKKERTIQPYITLHKILDKSFLLLIFDEPQSSIHELCASLTVNLSSNSNKDEYNPFANDFKNIYFEPEYLKQLINELNE